MIHNKRRLDHMLLGKFLKEKVQYVALSVTLFKCNALFLCNSLSLVIAAYFVKVNTGIFLYRVKHRNALKRLAEIYLRSVIGDNVCAEDLTRNMAVEIFGKIHHTMIIGICLIKLHEREFRVMAGIDTFVAEHSADLVDLFKPADYQPFEV